MSLTIYDSATGCLLEQITAWRNEASEPNEKAFRKWLVEPIYIISPFLALIESVTRGLISLFARPISIFLSPKNQIEWTKGCALRATGAALLSIVAFRCMLDNLCVDQIDLATVMRDSMPCFAPKRV